MKGLYAFGVGGGVVKLNFFFHGEGGISFMLLLGGLLDRKTERQIHFGGAAEATGLGFVCFVVFNSHALSANRVDLGFFLVSFLILPPTPTPGSPSLRHSNRSHSVQILRARQTEMGRGSELRLDVRSAQSN